MKVLFREVRTKPQNARNLGPHTVADD